MVQYVILSDIHGNMSALTAVVEDIRRKGDLSGMSIGAVTRSGGNGADEHGLCGYFSTGGSHRLRDAVERGGVLCMR